MNIRMRKLMYFLLVVLSWSCGNRNSESNSANIVSWGAYKLPEFLKTVTDAVAPVELNLSEATMEKWDQLLGLAAAKYTKQAIIAAKSKYMHVIRVNTAHFGVDPATPAIGDVRVELNYVSPGRGNSYNLVDEEERG